MTYYTYRKTARGEYRVTNWADQECGRYETEAEAQAQVVRLEDEMASNREQREAAQAEAAAFQQATPSLTEAQLTWQEWRNWFYGAMCWAAKDSAATQRALDRHPEHAGHPSYENQQSYLAEALREDQEAAKLYARAVDLDTRIKNARRQRDTAALAEALAEAPALIEEMQPFFATAGLPPPEPPTRSGTAPNASLVLSEDELAFIRARFGGRKSAAIHAALAALQRGAA